MTTSEKPLISVIMAVHNGKDCIKNAIDSILNQSFSNFELLIIDDGSIDATPQILVAYEQKDPRIRIISQKNTGLTIALNNGIKQACGKYIARQDVDDVSLLSRFEKQVALMEKNPSLVLIGGNSIDIYPDGTEMEWGWHPPKELQKTVFYKTPFSHSTAMFRKDVYEKLGGYDESFKTSQDMEFWMRFAKIGRIAMIKEPVIRRHIHSSSISAKRKGRQLYDATRARFKHARGFSLIKGFYLSLRGIMIALLPDSLAHQLKQIKSKLR